MREEVWQRLTMKAQEGKGGKDISKDRRNSVRGTRAGKESKRLSGTGKKDAGVREQKRCREERQVGRRN